MTKMLKYTALIGAVSIIAACEGIGGNQITDGGLDGGPLEDGKANIWVDPDGCQHWVIDDGLEGYMSPRLNRDGTPRCTAAERGETITTKGGAVIQGEPEPVR